MPIADDDAANFVIALFVHEKRLPKTLSSGFVHYAYLTIRERLF